MRGVGTRISSLDALLERLRTCRRRRKNRPAPVMTIAPIERSAFARSIASACSALICGVQAFSFSGRFSVTERDLAALLVEDPLIAARVP
jgi:hypothetical protein